MPGFLSGLWRRLQRRLPNRVLALVVLRGLVIVASVLWLVFAPPDLPRPGLVALVLAAFSLYGLGLYALLWFRPGAVLRRNLVVLCVDLAFALAVIRLTGGARSVFFLAFYLIAALQSYYYGMSRGVGVAVVSTALYFLVIWPTIDPAAWADEALRAGMLLVTALGLGLLRNMEEGDRLEILTLNQDLAGRERFIRDVVASLRDGVVVLDRERRVTGWNRAMASRSGVLASEALGQRLGDVFAGPGDDRVHAAVEGIYRGDEEAFVLERVQHETRQRGRVVLDVKGSAIRASDGALEGVVLLVEDVTERVAFERSLRQSEKLAALGTLAAGLAHEINNPIGIITSRIELMREDAGVQGLPKEARDDLEVLDTHARRVARITHGLLSFARRSPGEKVAVDVGRVVEDTMLLVAKQAQKEEIGLRVEVAPDLPPVLGDRTLLAQVLLNLVNNARDAVQAGGEIFVRAERDPVRAGWTRVIVRDTGVGIPEEHLGRLFEPFFTTKPGGTGLGLAMSYGIVREHGGLIGVESRPGEGATFVLSLPGAGDRAVGDFAGQAGG